METTSLEMFQQTVKYSDNFIWIKPVCDFFKINYENQTRKIKNDPILANQSTKKSNSLMFGDNYARILLTKKGFIRWIQLVNANTIIENLRDKFLKFQEMVFDYLFGSAEREEQAQVDYIRLKRLKSLYSRVGREIQSIEKRFTNYIENRFIQTKLDFNEPKKLKD